MAGPYSGDLRARMIASLAEGATCRGGGGALRGERVDGGELAAPMAGHRQCGGKADGWRHE